MTLEERIGTVLASWANTPYMPSSSVKGRGCDCIGFVSGVVNELYRKEFKMPFGNVANLSHDSDRFVSFFQACKDVWPVYEADEFEIGDILLHRPASGNAHVFFVGPNKTLWHSLHGMGVTFINHHQLHGRVSYFRLLNKESWL